MTPDYSPLITQLTRERDDARRERDQTLVHLDTADADHRDVLTRLDTLRCENAELRRERDEALRQLAAVEALR